MKFINRFLVVFAYIIPWNCIYLHSYCLNPTRMFTGRQHYDYFALQAKSKPHESKQDTRKAKLSTDKKSFPRININNKAHSSRTSRNKDEFCNQTWRLFNINVALDDDPGKDFIHVHDALTQSISSLARNDEDKQDLVQAKVFIVRKSFDSRIKKFGHPKFVYTIDIELSSILARRLKLYHTEGKSELMASSNDGKSSSTSSNLTVGNSSIKHHKPEVVIIGAGPSGLFAAVELCKAGYQPIIIDRGQPVEIRGRDIGALFNRKILKHDSNLCYGEGGAGTWSDGKLTTRIGKNSDSVRSVLGELVKHGAPVRILVDGKPHLGTDKLVRILQSLRKDLISQGATFLFNTTVIDIIPSLSSVDDDERMSFIQGVLLSNGTTINTRLAILAVGHSSRAMYERLMHRGIKMEAKPIAVGFRIEHPQALINRIQYGDYEELCLRGKGKIPVADYRLTADVSSSSDGKRDCYSFCMCPGGQIVPTAVDEEHLCVNGMSFSQRQSQWANAALVVNVDPINMIPLAGNSTLRGIIWQEIHEKKAALLGGGKLVAPVQRVTDFLANRVHSISDRNITSSYRLGINEAACHEIYPPFITDSIKRALLQFNQTMPGFICDEAILHGVETRTSSPVQIIRDRNTYECVSMNGLYPTGEGAGYAGGIMSAAVDGMNVAQALIRHHMIDHHTMA